MLNKNSTIYLGITYHFRILVSSVMDKELRQGLVALKVVFLGSECWN